MNGDLFFHIHYCNAGAKEPGTYNPIRTRVLSHHVLIFFSAGTGRFMLRDQAFPIRRGTLLYIGPNEPHTIEMRPEESVSVLTAHFSCEHVRFTDGHWDVQEELQTFPLRPVLQLPDVYSAEELFKKLVDGWYGKLPGYEFIARTLLQQLIIEITRNQQTENTNFTALQKVEQIIGFMQQHLDGKVTLQSLSALVHLSPAYLSRIFRETTGYTVIEYFTRLKIDKAKELLLEGGKKIKEVSRLLGFADEFYFSRTFKKAEGMTPSEFYSRIVHGA